MSPIEQLLKIIAPFACVGCGAEGVLLCAACQHILPVVPSRCYRCNRATKAYRTCTACQRGSMLQHVWVRTPYDDVAQELVHRLKFARAQAAARDIAAALAPLPPLESCQIITYVSTAPARIRLRGYDQARLIARELSRLTGLPCAALLARASSVRQVGNNRATRLQQMQHAFGVTHVGRLQNKHVLLVDDVITTGATCEAAARALRAAGAKAVSAVVFAAA